MTIWRTTLLAALIGFGPAVCADDLATHELAGWDAQQNESFVPPPEPLPWVPGASAVGSAPLPPPAPYPAPMPRPAPLLMPIEPGLPPPDWQRSDTVFGPVATPVPMPPAEPPMFTWPVSSAWYLRADYFHWNERMDGYDLLNEDGVLTTLGYERRIDRQRYVVELFGGDVHYSGAAVFDDGTVEPLASHTEYLGARAEWDMRFALDFWQRTYFFAGLGTRVWLRNLPNATTAEGDPVIGYSETWWTIYPYLGMEWSRPLGNQVEVYGSARLGVTALTFQYANIDDATTLSPAPGLTTQLEYGVRGPNLFLAGYLEVMGWGESPVVNGWLQPESTMLTAGIKAGFIY